MFSSRSFCLILYVLVCGSCHVKPEAGVEAPLPRLLSGFSSVSGELPLSLTAVLSGRLGVCEAASVWVLFSCLSSR